MAPLAPSPPEQGKSSVPELIEVCPNVTMDALNAGQPEGFVENFCRARDRCWGDPTFRRAGDIVGRHWGKFSKIFKEAIDFCPTSIGLLLALDQVQNSFRLRRDLGERNWISEHGSNFAQGLVYMRLLECFLRQSPLFARRPAMTGGVVIGANVLGNVWEEIDLHTDAQRSLPLFNSAGQRVKTDLADFSSGAILGGGAYWLLFHALQDAQAATAASATVEPSLCAEDKSP